MSPDIITAAPSIINSFGQTGGILGLIILALLAIVAAVAYMGWKFMASLMANHEARMDAQEARHQADRQSSNQQWQQVTRDITGDMKTVLDNMTRVQAGAVTTLERVDRNVEGLRRRRAA